MSVEDDKLKSIINNIIHQRSRVLKRNGTAEYLILDYDSFMVIRRSILFRPRETLTEAYLGVDMILGMNISIVETNKEILVVK